MGTAETANRRRLKTIATVLALSALLFVSHPSLSQADDETGPIFVKVFAGMSANSRREFDRQVRSNLKNKVAIEDTSVIPCETGAYYGLGVIVSAPGKQFFSFDTTAIWRDLDNYNEPRRYHKEHSLRKKAYGTRRFFYQIRSNSVDHDMIFVMHIGQQVYLRHKFEIRGCNIGAEPEGSG